MTTLPGRLASFTHLFILGALLTGAAVNTACANLTFDLRATTATGGAIVTSGKTVTGATVGTVVTLQLWAKVDGTGGTVTNTTYGIQAAIGSVITTSSPAAGGNVAGNMAAFNITTPFNALSQNGFVQSLGVNPQWIKLVPWRHND